MMHREDAGDVAVLRMEHGKVQAMDVEMLAELSAALDQVERSAARAVVLTGTGGSFSAGVDLFRVLDGGAAYVTRFLPLLDGTLRKLFLFPRPVVAALNGHAIAGGCLLACACDRRIAAAGKARIGVPELRVGVPFPVLPLEIVRFAAGERLAQELAYSGATWTMDVALQRGLVDEVVPPENLLERATAAAQDLGTIHAPAFEISKRQLRQPVLDACARERRLEPRVVETWSSPASAAAIRAYLEKTLGKSK